MLGKQNNEKSVKWADFCVMRWRNRTVTEKWWASLCKLPHEWLCGIPPMRRPVNSGLFSKWRASSVRRPPRIPSLDSYIALHLESSAFGCNFERKFQMDQIWVWFKSLSSELWTVEFKIQWNPLTFSEECGASRFRVGQNTQLFTDLSTEIRRSTNTLTSSRTNWLN